MDLLAFRDYCLSLPLTEETTPFDDTTLVYKVEGRIYAAANMIDFNRIAVKCEPDKALMLREEYPEICAAWHFNKRHWNDVYVNGDLPEAFIRLQIRNSYLLVMQQVTPRARREELLHQIEQIGIPE